MKRILPNNLQFIFLLLFFVFSGSVMAQCTITGVKNSIDYSCTSFSGCTTVIVGDGTTLTTLNINSDFNLSCLGPINFVIKDKAILEFGNGANDKLILGELSVITVETGGNISGGNKCTASDRIYFGTELVATCNGKANSEMSFDDIVSLGGTGKASSNSPVCLGQNIVLTATPPTSGTYTYSWSGPNSFTSTLQNPTPFSATAASGGVYQVEIKSGTKSVIAKTTLTITVNPNITPTFTAVAPICSGATLAALPTTSTNGITGTWSPALNNTATTTYTFTPTAGQCATTTTLAITVNPNVTPTFTAVGAICSGGVLSTLPTTSNNGITGTWSPALNNTTTTMYTFTPTAGQCATTTTLTITVNPLVSSAGTITGNDYVISGNTGTYTVPAILNATSYIWTYYDFSNVVLNTITTSLNSVTFTPTESVGYLKVRGSNASCIGQESNPFDIYVGLSPAPPMITGPTEVCKGQNGVIFSIDNIVTSYNWKVPDGVVIISGQGTKEITVNYTDLAVEGNVEISIVTPFGTALNSLPVKPKSNTWIGATNASWFTASNWSCGFVPTDKTDVVISDVTNDPMIDDTNTVAFAKTITVDSGSLTVNEGNTLNVKNKITNISGQLIFENSSSLLQDPTATTNPNTGEIIYKRKSSPMKNFDYTYWSSPVDNQDIGALSPNTQVNKRFRYSFTSTPRWIIHNGSMNPGVGYIIRVPIPGSPAPDNWSGPTYAQPVAFKGVPNNGNIDYLNVGPNQFHLIGNPYPSAINATQFIQENSGIIDGALYFWTHNTEITNNSYAANDYATFTLTGGATAAVSGGFLPNGSVAAGQSFFVKSKAGITTGSKITFTNAMREAGTTNAQGTGINQQFFKQTDTKKTATIEKNRVWLNLTNSQGAFKQMLIGYITGATNDWDNLYDGPTFNGHPFIDFYSVNNGKNLTIQGRALPFENTDEVPLGYRSTIAGTFDISIDSRDGLLANQEIWLEDKKTNTFHELSKGKYTFTTINGVENDRFVLKYLNTNKKLSSSEKELTEKQLLVSIENKKITITSSEETITKVQIFDMLGRKVYASSKINEQVWSITTLTASDQVLIVKTTLTNGSVSTKKIIY